MANLMSGLEAFANTGQGFVQGEQNAQDNQYKKEMQQLSYQDAALQFQQKKLDADRMQKLSDYSISKFMPTPVGPPPPGQANQPGQPGQQGPNASNTTNQDVNPEQYTQDMFNFAAKSGDVTHAQELATNLINMRNDQANQAQKQAQMQLTETKARQQALSTTAQMFQGVTDQASYDRTRFQIMSDPNMPQSARQAISMLPEVYSKPIVDHVVQQGQTLSQQMSEQIKQSELSEKIKMDQLKEKNDDIRNTLAAQKEKAYEQHLTSQTKVGAAAKVPSAADLAAAKSATKEAMGTDVDEDSDDFKNANNSIASRGLQIMRDNRAVNADQAFAMAADEAKRSGDFGTKTVEGKYAQILGVNIPGTKKPDTTKQTFTNKGDTQDKPIELHSGMRNSDIIDGKYYTYNGKTYVGAGGKLKPVQ
jgi:hypothetical protein